LRPYLIDLPGDFFQARDGGVFGPVNRIDEGGAKAGTELRAFQLGRCLALANFGHGGHRWTKSEVFMGTSP
jgi:hypothetical protein